MRIAVTRVVPALLGFVLYGIGALSYSQPNEVELALQCQKTSVGAIYLRITLRNTGSTSTRIVLGATAGNTEYPIYVVVEEKRDGNSAVEEFHLEMGNGLGGDWIVELPAISEVSSLQGISNYWSTAEHQLKRLNIGGSAIDVRLHWIAPEPPSPAFGELADRLNALTAGRRNALMGELTSEWLRVPDQCHAV